MQYPPVVASGTDALTIHYGRNDKLLADGDLLLMDAGCELHGCVTDVDLSVGASIWLHPPIEALAIVVGHKAALRML